ncbi:MAG: class I SAM-dependent methyltransferase [Chloroflexi bacterium]|nr:class I SAM-dependent methyltransferase [Chloroflexota bacterium]
MQDYVNAINSQYGSKDLSEKILAALTAAGRNLDDLTLDDLASFDELHSGGRESTRALAKLADIQPGMQVLDIGCGIGGPARTLASEFGCRVVGVDITKEFVDAAQMLSAKLGLSDKVSFREGNALDLAFEDEAFDVVWSQNAIMNIKDKAAFAREARRVLRPEGTFALATILAGREHGLQYPVFWADDPRINFLVTPEDLRRLLSDAGLIEREWRDVTPWEMETSDGQQTAPSDVPPALGVDILFEDVPLKRKNTMRGLEMGQLANIFAVFARTP